jgi:hypothetical protein
MKKFILMDECFSAAAGSVEVPVHFFAAPVPVLAPAYSGSISNHFHRIFSKKFLQVSTNFLIFNAKITYKKVQNVGLHRLRFATLPAGVWDAVRNIFAASMGTSMLEDSDWNDPTHFPSWYP